MIFTEQFLSNIKFTTVSFILFVISDQFKFFLNTDVTGELEGNNLSWRNVSMEHI